MYCIRGPYLQEARDINLHSRKILSLNAILRTSYMTKTNFTNNIDPFSFRWLDLIFKVSKNQNLDSVTIPDHIRKPLTHVTLLAQLLSYSESNFYNYCSTTLAIITSTQKLGIFNYSRDCSRF